MNTQEVIAKGKKILAEHGKKLEELEKYANWAKYCLSAPIGLFGNKCPECKRKVILTKHSMQPNYMTGFQLWEWICPNGDYRYVEERDYTN